MKPDMSQGQNNKWLVPNRIWLISFFKTILLPLFQVFCNGWQPDKEYDFWIVIPAHKKHHQPGSPIPYNSVIGLKHQKTGRNLHSHGACKSPKTQEQEGGLLTNYLVEVK
jgi:hypothetical protein